MLFSSDVTQIEPIRCSVTISCSKILVLFRFVTICYTLAIEKSKIAQQVVKDRRKNVNLKHAILIRSCSILFLNCKLIWNVIMTPLTVTGT